jgi:phenylacetate-CoA ligase
MIREFLRSIRRLKNHAPDKQIKNRLAEIQVVESLTAAEKRAKQLAALDRILDHARRTVPYYRQWLNQGDLREQFFTLPFMTKQSIRQSGDQLRSQSKLADVEENTSGGTSGEPVTILQDASYRAWRSAYVEHHYRCLTGLPGGRRRLLRLWGSERDLLDHSRDFRTRLRSYVHNTAFLNSFCMSDRQIEDYINTINRFKPDVIESYVQSLDLLAHHAAYHARQIYDPRGIVVSAGCYEDSMDELFRKVFPTAKIANRYGSREFGAIACSCDGPEHLHVSTLTHYVEIADDEGNLQPDGSLGNIVVTSLTNLAMPLLRYEIGDRGVLQRDATCPKCGWQGDLITRVVGRTVDVFLGQDGSRVDGEFFTHLFYFRPWLKRFQVVQNTHQDLEVRIVLGDSADKIPQADRTEISSAITKVLVGTRVNWVCVPEIEYDRSGKLRYTISRVGKN